MEREILREKIWVVFKKYPNKTQKELAKKLNIRSEFLSKLLTEKLLILKEK